MSITVTVDTHDDGAHALDLTPYLLDVTWHIGMRAPFDHMAAIGEAHLTVRGPLDPAEMLGRVIHIRADEMLYFRGWIDHITPDAGDQRAPSFTLTAHDLLGELAAAPITLPARTAVAADDLLASIVNAARVRMWHTNGLPVVGTGTIGHARLPDTERPALDPQPARATLSHVGGWADATATDAARDVVEAERGRLFAQRDGTLAFRNRHADLQDTPPVATLNADMRGLSLAYGASRVTTVTVEVTPRTVDASDEAELWRLGESLRVPALSARFLRVPFRDAQNAAIAAKTVQQPLGYAHYTVNTHPIGHGADITAWVEWRVLQADADGVHMVVFNRHTADGYIQAGAALYGQAVRTASPYIASASDSAAAARTGRHHVRLSVGVLDSSTDAEDIAQYELSRRASPRLLAEQVTLAAPYHAAHQRAVTLFDRVAIDDVGYWVVGESHRVPTSTTTHATTWTLEPVNTAGFWRLGIGALGVSTRLAY